MYRTCKIPAEQTLCQCLSGEFLMLVKRTKSKRGCSIVKVLSVTNMRRREDEQHNAKGSQVCFQRILSEIKSIPGSGTVQRPLLALCHGPVVPLPRAASLTLQVIYLSVLHQSHPVFSEITIYLLFVSLAPVFLWLTSSHTSASALPVPFFGPQLGESLLLKQATPAYF